jgi:hypothetical protein
MDTSFLDNQEELNISQFNGSFRKALDKKADEDSGKKSNTLKPVRKKNNNSDYENPSPAVEAPVRISVSQAIDKKIREMILKRYIETGERISIKQFVENCISYYFTNNRM